MSPAEHLAIAEALTTQAAKLDNAWSEGERISVSILALTHATIALAIEQGAPHAAAPGSGAGSG